MQPVIRLLRLDRRLVEAMVGRGQVPVTVGPELAVVVQCDQHHLAAVGLAAFAEHRHPGDEFQPLGSLRDPIVRRPHLVGPVRFDDQFPHRHLAYRTCDARPRFRSKPAKSENVDVSLPEERAARNEALFREVNEQVRSLADTSDRSQLGADFVCECSQDTCMERVHVPVATYEAVRGHPRRFIVLPGHESDFEHVVERNDGFLIVEKEGTAGRVAERSDPRS